MQSVNYFKLTPWKWDIWFSPTNKNRNQNQANNCVHTEMSISQSLEHTRLLKSWWTADAGSKIGDVSLSNLQWHFAACTNRQMRLLLVLSICIIIIIYLLHIKYHIKCTHLFCRNADIIKKRKRYKQHSIHCSSITRNTWNKFQFHKTLNFTHAVIRRDTHTRLRSLLNSTEWIKTRKTNVMTLWSKRIILFKNTTVSDNISLQCFDAVGWAAGRASGL